MAEMATMKFMAVKEMIILLTVTMQVILKLVKVMIPFMPEAEMM
jgi:hypothetical protein